MYQLAEKCSALTQEFASCIHALHFSERREKKNSVFTILTNLSKIEFVYVGKGSVLCPQSTLFVRIFPLKTRDMFFHLYELMEEDDFRCTYFTYIESEQRMEVCFHNLSHILLEYLPKIEALVRDRERFAAVTEQKYNTVQKLLGIKEQDIPKEAEHAEIYWMYCFAHFEKFVQVVRFTQFDGYRYFLEGRLDKARASYAKLCEKGRFLPFEQRLYEFIQKSEAVDYVSLSSECAAYLDAQRYIGNKKQGLHLLRTGGLLYLIFFILFLMLGLTIELVRANGTVYYSYHFYETALLAAALPAVFGSFSLRRILAKAINRKNWKQELAFDDISNSKTLNRVSHVLFGIVLAVCIFFAVVFSCASPKFYQDYMVYDDAEKFPLLNPVVYHYEEIVEVYHIAGRYNIYGDYIGRSSYVLRFQNGILLDFDGSTLSEPETEECVLPLLKPYTGDVIALYSDREIPDG